MLAAARPLPSEDTTPPVMKMYFGVRSMILVPVRPKADTTYACRGVRLQPDLLTRCRGCQQSTHLLQVLRRVDFERFVTRFDGFDADPVLERAQLLEGLGALQRRRLERRQHQQGAAAIRVETDMSIERGPSAPGVPDVGDGGAREIQREPAP